MTREGFTLYAKEPGRYVLKTKVLMLPIDAPVAVVNDIIGYKMVIAPDLSSYTSYVITRDSAEWIVYSEEKPLTDASRHELFIEMLARHLYPAP